MISSSAQRCAVQRAVCGAAASAGVAAAMSPPAIAADARNALRCINTSVAGIAAGQATFLHHRWYESGWRRRTSGETARMIDRRRFALGAAAGAALAALPRAARAADAVHVATPPLDAGAECYYALDMGFFRDAGIDAQVEGISNGAVIASAVSSGAADVGFANLLSIATAYKRNLPLTVIAPGSLYVASDPTSVLMVPKTSTLKTAADFSGKTLAASGLGTITEYAPRLWLDKNGGDSTSVKFIEMAMPQILPALAAGRIDGAIVAEPFIAPAKAGARVFADAYDALGKRYLIGVYFTTIAWAKAHPDLVARIQATLAKTADWANKNTTQSGEILVKYSKLDPALLRTMLRVQYAPRFNPAEMQPVIDLAAHFNAIPATFPAEELIFKP
jgi:NitT/TauT family transport system substrate-binding protein